MNSKIEIIKFKKHKGFNTKNKEKTTTNKTSYEKQKNGGIKRQRLNYLPNIRVKLLANKTTLTLDKRRNRTFNPSTSYCQAPFTKKYALRWKSETNKLSC